MSPNRWEKILDERDWLLADGATGTVKGDIEFGNNLKTENGADIDGYIKKTNTSKSKLADSFMFSKSRDEKKPKEEQPETVVNKDSEAIA